MKAGKAISVILALIIIIQMVVAVPLSVIGADEPLRQTLKARFSDSDGNSYTVCVTYNDDAGIPAGALLSAQAVEKDVDGYGDYVAQATETLGCSADDVNNVHFFDISITDPNDNDRVVQPVEGSVVSVFIRLNDKPEDDFNVIHFGEGTELLDSTTIGETVTFETTGFSVYAIVDAPGPNGAYDDIVRDIDEIAGGSFLVSVTTASGKEYWMKNSTVSTSNAGVVITRTAANDPTEAVFYHFEQVGTDNNQFYIYYLDDQNVKRYVKLTNDTNAQFTTTPGTVFTAQPCGAAYPNCYYFSFAGTNGRTYYLNLRKGDSGRGFSGSTYGPATNDVGSMITLYKSLRVPEDTLALDGRTFGLVLYKGTTNVIELTHDALNAGSIAAREINIMANPMDRTQNIIVPADGSMTMCTFHYISDGKYHITTEVDGVTKFLTLEGSAARWQDEPDEYSEIQVISGTGSRSGYLRFVGSSYPLGLRGSNVANGFSCGNYGAANEWFKLAEPVNFDVDDFVSYTANKVSVSDTLNVRNHDKVVVYTRVWDESSKKYKLYAIDHNGALVDIFNEGDTVRWNGTQVNTLLWEFEEYYYEGTNNPNYYYELRNTYSGKYLAPQIDGSQVLSDVPVGININGRRYGDYYSKIVAWDDPHYDYAGLKFIDGELIPVPMSQSDYFYFAKPDQLYQELTTAPTVDNNDYGISMKMIKFPPPVYGTNNGGGGRNALQTAVLGEGTDYSANLKLPTSGLVSTDLDANGYPVATVTGRSLQDLFGNATDANHLFLQSVYDGSGYFQYDSTQSFATLGNDGNFTVYNELGTIETQTNSQGHGQFMPYNDLDPTVISQYVNLTDVYNNPLPLDHPRLNEQMYSIPFREANYHFGMEMEASFIQTKDGLDAFGHDIIFEFAGDDDMWLYVDGELVLDLGGIHSALVGKINFSTGEVVMPSKTETSGNSAVMITTTLWQIFKDNYETRHPQATAAEVQEYLDSIFVTGRTPGSKVFKDYTAHKMQMFYMERGAGASNLYMRFNLTTATNGQLILGKQVSGTDKQDYASVRFPYQIWYYDNDYNEWKTVKRTGSGSNIEYVGAEYVNYEGTSIPVEYQSRYQNQYDDVFFIKPGQFAEIQFPNDSVQYYIKECRVDTDIYDQVSANDNVLTGVSAGSGFSDFSTEPEVIGDRKIVNFNNHVDEDALRTMSITKKLFDAEGNPLTYQDDPTGFRFRLYLGEDLDYYRMDSYYVKDPQGFYCTYSAASSAFVSTGVSDFSQLTASQREAATFTTSPSGAIDKIPADYTVEIRNLLVDTRFKVEERSSDIPAGYNLINYERVDGSYIVSQGDTENSGTIRDNSSPHVIVNNERGWGLTVKKVWSDASFMASHDNIFFAVYRNGTLIPGTVRQMKAYVTADHPVEEKQVYYYFDALQGSSFSDYVVKEVILTDPTFNSDGDLTGYSSVTPVGGSVMLEINGEPLDPQTGSGTFTYSASYNVGQPTGAADNVRVDTVTNSRPGIRIVKTDYAGDPLQGSVFTLNDPNGDPVGSASYTSAIDGLVTTAYLRNNVSYTLSETKAPDGYVALIDSVTLTLNGNDLTVNGGGDNVTVDPNDPSGMTTVYVKNREMILRFLKIDTDSELPLSGAKFALYRQVMGSSGPRKDYVPMNGYSGLTTGSNGEIPLLNNSLPPGVYYLTETRAPNGYDLLGHDLCFSIDQRGIVTILNEESVDWLDTVTTGSLTSYVVNVPNAKVIQLTILKKGRGNEHMLRGASFELYAAADFNDQTGRPRSGAEPVASGTTQAGGILDLGDIHSGEYKLIETQAPIGYDQIDHPLTLTVTPTSVTLEDNGVVQDAVLMHTSSYRVTVYNDVTSIVPLTGVFDSFPYIPCFIIMLAVGSFIAVRFKRRYNVIRRSSAAQ